MADRGWFGRGRSAHTAQQQPQQHHVSLDTQGEAGDQAHHALHPRKPPKLSKISSYIGLGSLAKAQSPTVTMYPELIMERSESIKPGAAGSHITSVDGGGPIGAWRPALKGDGTSSFYNAEDSTWHNPSLKQMVETVSCTMMKNGSSAPIPRHLNGWIAGIMEEVSHQTRELAGLRKEMDRLQKTREQEVIEVAKVTEEWELREKDFKAEINRLEHIISDTQQGAESVMLARAGSVVDRNDGRAFRAKVERLSRSDEGDGRGLEEDRRDRVALSPDDVGLNVNTTPYEVLGSTPGLLDHNGIHLSKQLREATPRRDRKRDQDIGARMAAARISLQTTGKPPAPSPQNSNDSSSQSSSGSASCSSSLIAQGLAKVAQAKVTPHTSPTKDENLCGRPAEEQDKGDDALVTIRQFAAQNGGLPDDAILDESSCSSPIVDSRDHRTFSFSDGDDRIVSQDGNDSIARTSTNVGDVGSSSRRPLQLSAAHEQSLGSQIDGASRSSNGVATNASVHQKSSSSSSSSDTSQRRSHASVLRSMGHNHAAKANKDRAAADEFRKLELASFCSPMIVAMARERSVPSPSKKEAVQEEKVPRGNHVSRVKNLDQPQSRAFISDEELALTPNRRASDQDARGRAPTDVARNQEATVDAARAVKRSTSGHDGYDGYDGQNESDAQAA